MKLADRLAGEFTAQCVSGKASRDDLLDWMASHGDLRDVPWLDMRDLCEDVEHILTSRTVIVIK